MTEVMGRIERIRRERRLAEFVDRSDEMALFEQVLDSEDKPVMVVSAESGMGKTSLLWRMVHECSLRPLLKVELEWKDTLVFDYMAVMRRLRDDLDAPEHFSAFTDLINYYTDDSYQPRLDITVQLQGGSISVAQGAQISGSTVGDIAGVVLRDNQFVIQRPDIPVPMEVRREQLTRRFVQGLKSLSSTRGVVLFFNATEKMSDITHQWLWEQLLAPVVNGELPRVRAVLLGQRPAPDDRDLAEFMARVVLKPLEADDIDAYIAKRAAGKTEISDEVRHALAEMLVVAKGGRPADVASTIDAFLVKRGVA